MNRSDRAQTNANFQGERRAEVASKPPSCQLKTDMRKSSGGRFLIKLCLTGLLLTSVLVIILQASSDSKHLVDAKKLKLKDLKKLKKYAFLLASQRNRLYAIPFPVPLPVFVKRQHIYTQVPVVPRYVQRPYQHQYPVADQADSYAAAASQPASSSATGYSASTANDVVQPSSQVPTYRAPVRGHTQKPNRYFAQLANVIGQSNPVLGSIGGVTGIVGSQRDVVNKLLSGQAKLLAPNMGALLSTIKSQQNQNQEYMQHRQRIYESSQPMPEVNEIQSESSSTTTTSSAREHLVGKGNSTARKQLEQPQSVRTASASVANIYQLPVAADSLHKQAQLAELYRLAGHALPFHFSPRLMSAQAAAAALAASRMTPAIDAPINPQVAAAAAAQLMRLVEPQVSEASEGVEVRIRPDADSMEAQASEQHADVEVAPGLATRLSPEQVILALRGLEQQRLIHAHLAQQREEAQMAESNTIALAAQHLGLPGQLRLVNF